MARVYIKTDDKNRVTAVNSSVFLKDAAGWIQIDEGLGDRFVHAQGNYFSAPLTAEKGVSRYKYENGRVRERSAAEISADLAEVPAPPLSAEELASALMNVYEAVNDGLKDIADRDNPLRVELPFPVKRNLIYEFDGVKYVCLKSGIASAAAFGEFFAED